MSGAAAKGAGLDAVAREPMAFAPVTAERRDGPRRVEDVPAPTGAVPTAAAPVREALAGAVFLFLQGPASPFGFRLAQALIARGARVEKVHLCGGDLVFWPGAARLYRGRLADWPAYLERLMAEARVSDLVLFGDCRPYHVPAIACARALGLRMHLLEEGYVRPGRITCERAGVNAHSDLPREPAQVRAQAAGLPEPADAAPLEEPFAPRALWDVRWHLGYGALAPLFRHYRRHTLIHPARDYAGWVLRWLGASGAARRDRAARARLAGEGAYFLFPLQLEGDFQMRVHSDFGSVEEVARLVLGSFAQSAPAGTALLVKRHPYDTRFPASRHMIARLAAELGLAERVVFIEDGDIEPLVAGSAGVVLVNSTTAMLALKHGRPLKVLGRATYDMAGLSHQGALDGFWRAGAAPDPALVAAYRRLVIARTQLDGGFFAPQAIARAVDSLVARFEAERMAGARGADPMAEARG
ncbi:capsule biosynthesis protein [Ancylobacter radicis]|uniref:Capsular biosynthesis protein n=1 Tax=Ancylobacter radicis TaxID=2836179 RepID=A0ABS5RB94_9HYPH|nr:capsular biosynthesis protein [Ancylobacter radicis]MBS9478931.1 capsular biosynthesis protein [Ancylobacter radicis]